jgi:endonuclease-8
MGGAWHRYRPGEPWRRPAWQARVVLSVPEHVVVCFNAPTVELLPDRAVALHPSLAGLGPDLLDAGFDADEAVRRLRRRPELEIADALLDQTALAGIGNVFKSEILFIERINPWTPVGSVDDDALRRVVETAVRLLRENVRPGRFQRVTTGHDPAGHGAALWVYGRAQRPCRRCGTPIRSRRQGQLSRLTYWCPGCQP